MRKNRIILFAGLGVIMLGLLVTAGCLPTAAPAQGTTGGFDWTLIIFMVVIFAVMYLLMIRPQRKRQKEQRKLTESLKRGDDVMTNAGIYGVIDSIDENSIVLKLESGATMRVAKGVVVGRREQPGLR